MRDLDGFNFAGVRLERDGDLVYVHLETPEAIRIGRVLFGEQLPTLHGKSKNAEVWVYRVSEES